MGIKDVMELARAAKVIHDLAPDEEVSISAAAVDKACAGTFISDVAAMKRVAGSLRHFWTVGANRIEAHAEGLELAEQNRLADERLRLARGIADEYQIEKGGFGQRSVSDDKRSTRRPNAGS